MEKKTALSIAGSDPSCGAGLQADLKSFNVIDVYGLTVVTCVTVQNTQKVKKIIKLDKKVVGEQIDFLADDIRIDTVKTGMLYDKEIVYIVSKKILQFSAFKQSGQHGLLRSLLNALISSNLSKLFKLFLNQG